MAHVGLDHVAAETGRHLKAPNDRTQRTPEHILVARVGTLEGLVQPTLVTIGGWKVEGESGVGALEATMDIAVRRRLVPRVVDVDVRLPEKRVLDDVCIEIHGHSFD